LQNTADWPENWRLIAGNFLEAEWIFKMCSIRPAKLYMLSAWFGIFGTKA